MQIKLRLNSVFKSKAGNARLADHNQAGLALLTGSAATRDNLHCSNRAHIFLLLARSLFTVSQAAGPIEGKSTCRTRRRRGPAQRPTCASDVIQLLLKSSCVKAAHAVRFCTVPILFPDKFSRPTAGRSAREESIVWKEFAEHVRDVRLGHAAAASAAPAPRQSYTLMPIHARLFLSSTVGSCFPLLYPHMIRHR